MIQLECLHVLECNSLAAIYLSLMPNKSLDYVTTILIFYLTIPNNICLEQF